MKQTGHPPRRRSWLSVQIYRRPLPAWIVALLHLLALGVALVLFALPHHVIPRSRASLGIVSARDVAPADAVEAAIVVESSATPEAALASSAEPSIEASPLAAEASPSPEATAEPAAPRVGDFSAKFADKFVAGEATHTDTTYVSPNLNIAITEYYVGGTRFYVADFYVRDISCFRTAFAKDKYGRNITEDIAKVVKREQSVLTINGDYYGVRDKGACMRNGELYYSKDVVRDACVLYWDGRMQCFAPDAFDCEREVANGAYQIWSFGPSVLDAEGHARTEFAKIDEDIEGHHPRSALGYFEPGHYCFITADGRTKASSGLTLKQLGMAAEKLGCVACYNMDGGQTAKMCFGTGLVNNPVQGGRDCSDYLTIVDRVS